MFDIQKKIASYKIPYDSYIAAVQTIREQGDLEPTEYQRRLADMVGEPVDFRMNDPREPKYLYGYFIQETIRKVNAGDPIDPPHFLEVAREKVVKYFDEYSWVFATPEEEVKLKADGTPAPKKGDKKVLARQVYDANKAKNLSRKEWIALLVKEVELTPAGASTYYANLKSGKY